MSIICNNVAKVATGEVSFHPNGNIQKGTIAEAVHLPYKSKPMEISAGRVVRFDADGELKFVEAVPF